MKKYNYNNEEFVLVETGFARSSMSSHGETLEAALGYTKGTEIVFPPSKLIPVRSGPGTLRGLVPISSIVATIEDVPEDETAPGATPEPT